MGVPFKSITKSVPVLKPASKQNQNQNQNPIIQCNKLKTLKCCTWNIRRGLLTKESELTHLLNNEKIDIMFLTETDSQNLINEDSYVIKGYKSFLPLKNPNINVVRIVCLVKENLLPFIKVRSDLMSEDFPSIWLEYQPDLKKAYSLFWLLSCLDSRW